MASLQSYLMPKRTALWFGIASAAVGLAGLFLPPAAVKLAGAFFIVLGAVLAWPVLKALVKWKIQWSVFTPVDTASFSAEFDAADRMAEDTFRLGSTHVFGRCGSRPVAYAEIGGISRVVHTTNGRETFREVLLALPDDAKFVLCRLPEGEDETEQRAALDALRKKTAEVKLGL